MLGGAARQRRGERQAREERPEHVAQALSKQLLVGINRVLVLFREEQRHRHGHRVRDDRYDHALRDDTQQQVHGRRPEIWQAPFDFAYLKSTTNHRFILPIPYDCVRLGSVQGKRSLCTVFC